MRRLLVRNLRPGAVLGKTLFNERGDPLLVRGSALSARYIELLAAKGFRHVYVEDPEVDDLVADDIVSDYVRASATGTIYRFLDLVERVARRTSLNARAATPTAIEQAIQDGDFAKVTRDAGVHETLLSSVTGIVDEVVDAPTLTGLTSIKSHDNYTFCHSVDVAITAVMVGKTLFLDREALRQLALGCLLHDVGKILIDPAILNKPGPLTAAEFEQMKKHALFGYQILRSLQPEEALANSVAYEHHERQDGQGYPRGLRGSNRISREGPTAPGRIHLIGEIAAVADVYDALTADRPYRPAFAPDRIVDILNEMTGRALNREVVSHFFAAVPVYPLGIPVRVKNGRHRGWTGVVSRLNEHHLDRPVVRLLRDDHGKRCALEVDLARERDVEIGVVLG